MKRTCVVALGGNAILPSKSSEMVAEQLRIIERTMEHIATLIEKGWHVVLTHGNGPQVGNILLQQEMAKDIVPQMPLDVCGARTQGEIGYLAQKALRNILKRKKLGASVVTLVTQVEVNEKDPAFSNPTKPIGPFYEEKDVPKLRQKGFVIIEDSGRGWRRVVPSPKPLHIVEKDALKDLIKAGAIVITCGGGGIPVIRKKNGSLSGTEAVIDKDLCACLLAKEVGADLLLIVTGVDRVALNFGKPNQRLLEKLTIAEARKYMKQGHFPPGSMGPKIEASINFVKGTGKEAIITSPSQIGKAIKGKAGTRIVAK